MKRLADIDIDSRQLDAVIANVEIHGSDNPACALSGYWKGRMNFEIRKAIEGTKKLSYGYVGSGWPYKANQDWARSKDTRGLFSAFHVDDWDTRDVGDAVYQANVLLDYIGDKGEMSIVDIGCGYGRLAIPIVYWARSKGIRLAYWGVDYVPESLLIAPQVLSQMFGIPEVPEFRSLPAWNIDALEHSGVDAFITVHSIQEMTRDAVDYYVYTADHKKGALFYSVNLWPEEYAPASWELIFDRKFPINRDGSYNEKLWRVI